MEENFFKWLLIKSILGPGYIYPSKDIMQLVKILSVTIIRETESLFYTWLTGKDLLPFQGHTCRLDIEYYIIKYYIKVWTLPVYVYPQPQDTSLKFSHHYLKPKYIFLNNFMNTSHWLAVNHLLYVLHFLILNGNSHRLLNLVMLLLSELICLGY